MKSQVTSDSLTPPSPLSLSIYEMIGKTGVAEYIIKIFGGVQRVPHVSLLQYEVGWGVGFR